MNESPNKPAQNLYDQEIASFYHEKERTKVQAVARGLYGDYQNTALLVLTPDYLGVHQQTRNVLPKQSKTEPIWPLVNIEEPKIHERATGFVLWIKSRINSKWKQSFVIEDDPTDLRSKIQELHRTAMEDQAQEEVQKLETALELAKDNLNQLKETP